MTTSTLARRLCSTKLVCALALLAPAACDAPEDESLAEDLAGEADADTTVSVGADSLIEQRGTAALPGYGVAISVAGDDVVLDWSATGPTGQGVLVYRSSDAAALVDLDGSSAPPAGVEQIVLPFGTTQFVDVGAADGDQPTADAFYRVNVTGNGSDGLSTVVMKRSTAMAPGYNKFGLCMLDGPSRASDVAAQLGSSVTGVFTWDAALQSYLAWTPAQGVGSSSDYSLPLGSVVAAQVDGSTPAYQTLVGTVPTAEAFAITAAAGNNWQIFPALFDGPGSASYWVDEIGYMGMGAWNNLTQSADWYWGPQHADFDVAPCQPYYAYQGADACTSADDCSADSFCDFTSEAACGNAAAGLCKARPIGCEFAEGGEVCGCDGETYASACEAELAGVSIADEAACPEPEPEPEPDPWVTGAWNWFNNVVVWFQLDGSCSAANGFTCTWSVVDETTRHIVIIWNGGQYVDNLTLSADGNFLSGTNQFGHYVTGNRQP